MPLLWNCLSSRAATAAPGRDYRGWLDARQLRGFGGDALVDATDCRLATHCALR